MNNVKTPFTTRTLGVSQGYLPLHITDGQNPPTMLSFWQPNKEELELLNAGHGIILSIMGNSHPPVMLEVADKIIPIIKERVS